MNKEKEFVWNDELVKEYGEWYKKIQSNPPSTLWGKDLFSHFKEQKLKEEEKPVVEGMLVNDEGCHIWLSTDKTKTFEISKERLAEILIAESKGKLIIKDDYVFNAEKIKNQIDKIEFGEKCFNAARERCFNGLNSIGNSFLYPAKYENFTDFMNSINDK